MTVVDALQAALPAGCVVADPDLLTRLSSDEASWVVAGQPVAAVLARSTEQVATAVRVATEHHAPVVPRGAGTGLSGGATAVEGCVLICTEAMTSVLQVDPVEKLAVAQAGVLTADLDAGAAAHGLWYPPDPASWQISTIGGNVATNAGGLCCLRWGTTGSYVLGLTVVLADGTVLHTGRRTRKGVAGLDLTSLLVGSEGVLGVITEVTVRLVPRRPQRATVVGLFAELAGCGRAVTTVLGAGVAVDLLEVMDRTTLRAVQALRRMGLGDPAALLVAQAAPEDLTALEQALSAAGALEVHASADPQEASALLEARRCALPALQATGPVLLDDICVPIGVLVPALEGIEAIAARTGVSIGTFGHAGDGNLHPTISVTEPDRARLAFEQVLELALSLGGTCTGEHGIGVMKAPWLETELGADSVRAQRAIKRALDPNWLMNPGKVF